MEAAAREHEAEALKLREAIATLTGHATASTSIRPRDWTPKRVTTPGDTQAAIIRAMKSMTGDAFDVHEIVAVMGAAGSDHTTQSVRAALARMVRTGAAHRPAYSKYALGPASAGTSEATDSDGPANAGPSEGGTSSAVVAAVPESEGGDGLHDDGASSDHHHPAPVTGPS